MLTAQTIEEINVESAPTVKKDIQKVETEETTSSAVAHQVTLSKADIKTCKSLLHSLQHHPSAWPFKAPVDPSAAGAPDYEKIIKTPMDLSTVDKKLKTNMYHSPREFIQDVMLMLSNCFVYNPSTHVVHEEGRSLENFFGTILNKSYPMYALVKPSTQDQSAAMVLTTTSAPYQSTSAPTGSVATDKPRRTIKAPKLFDQDELIPSANINLKQVDNAASHKARRKSSSTHTFTSFDALPKTKSKKRQYQVDDESSEDEDAQISTLMSCLQNMQQQLSLLTSKKSYSIPSSSTHAPKKAKKNTSIKKSPTKHTSPTIVVEKSTPEFTYANRQELSTLITQQSTNEQFMTKIISMITKAMPHLKNAEEELELDLSIVPEPALWKMFKFCKGFVGDVHSMSSSDDDSD